MSRTEQQFIPLNIAILTVSDTRTEADDISGTTLVERLEQAGHQLYAKKIVTDSATHRMFPERYLGIIIWLVRAFDYNQSI
jgi:hypothetical protein